MPHDASRLARAANEKCFQIKAESLKTKTGSCLAPTLLLFTYLSLSLCLPPALFLPLSVALPLSQSFPLALADHLARWVGGLLNAGQLANQQQLTASQTNKAGGEGAAGGRNFSRHFVWHLQRELTVKLASRKQKAKKQRAKKRFDNSYNKPIKSQEREC